MAITTDLSTPVGKVRFEIGDDNDAAVTTDAGVKPDGSNYTDDQIKYFLSEASQNFLIAAALACENLRTLWAAESEKIKIRDYTVDTTKKVNDYKALAIRLRQRAAEQAESNVAGSATQLGGSVSNTFVF